MKKPHSIFVALLLAATGHAHTLTPELDRQLTGGKTSREFFEARAADTLCVSKMITAREAYKEKLKKLREFAQSGQASTGDIQRGESEVKKLKLEWYELVEKCGPCVTKAPTADAANPQNLLTDGSCQLPTTDPAELAAVYEKIRDSLSTLSGYGFPQIVGLLPVDTETTPSEFYEPSPLPGTFEAFLAIKPPVAINGAGLFYFLKCDRNEKGTTGARSFQLFFRTPDAGGYPEDFQALEAAFRQKKLEYLSEGLRPLEWRATVPLREAAGQWYFTEDGYLRYQNYADFSVVRLPFIVTIIKKMGREILMDQLIEMYERAVP